MAAHRRFFPNLGSAFSIVIMIAVWLAFAPTQVGGLASYIIVIGKSMEPKFHIGDLVIVHEEPMYQIGDAIVYRNRELNSFVFHRIISQQMERYTLKGDNNSWVDTYQPDHKEVIGKLWLHIPQGGIAIQKIRSPFALAILAAGLGTLLVNSLFVKKVGGNKRMTNKSLEGWFPSIKQRTRDWFTKLDNPKPQNSVNWGQGEIVEGSFFLLGLIAVSSLILGIIAFSRPAARTAQDDISYEHLGIFSYSATTPQGVYDANTIKSGDPIFTKLICSTDVNFQYTLVAARAENITGTYQLTAVISEPVSGWQRIVPLQEITPFTGTALGTTAGLDFCKIETLAQSMEQKTDSHPGSYIMVVTPNIKLNGEVSDRALEGVFSPNLTFRYDHSQFYLVRNEEQNNPLTFTESGVLFGERQETNTLLLLGKELAIPTLRWIASLGLITSLSGLILMGLKLQQFSQNNQEKFFRIKYDSVMIDVQNADSLFSSKRIDVTSMAVLAKLAERFNALILHAEEGTLHTYYVQAGEITYRFVIIPHEMESTIPDASPEAINQESGT
jgi:signal peptidase